MVIQNQLTTTIKLLKDLNEVMVGTNVMTNYLEINTNSGNRTFSTVRIVAGVYRGSEQGNDPLTFSNK